MAADDGEIVAKAGPFPLPGGSGTLSWDDRQNISKLTGVSAAVRDRKNTHGVRFLTLSGPVGGMDLAKRMAMQYVVNSQKKNESFKETPGGQADWVAPTDRQQTKLEGWGTSSSWQPFA